MNISVAGCPRNQVNRLVNLWGLAILVSLGSGATYGQAAPDVAPTLQALEEAVQKKDATSLEQLMSFEEQAGQTVGLFLREFSPVLRCHDVVTIPESDLALTVRAQCQVSARLGGKEFRRGPVPLEWGVAKDPTALHGYRIVEHNLAEMLLPFDVKTLNRIAWSILISVLLLLIAAAAALVLAVSDPDLNHRGRWLAALVVLAPLSSVVYLAMRLLRPRVPQASMLDK